MPDAFRRLVALVFAVGCFAGAWVLGANATASRSHAALAKAHQEAEQQLVEVKAKLLAEVAQQAATAAKVGPLVKIVTSEVALGDAESLKVTVLDSFTDEASFASFRADHVALSLVVGSAVVASQAEVDPAVLLELASAAGTAGHAERIARTPSGVALLAASQLADHTQNGLAAVVVTARQLDHEALTQLSNASHQTLAVRVGDVTLAAGAGQTPLRVFIERPADDAPCCALTQVADGVKLAVWKDPVALESEAQHEAAQQRFLYFGGAGLLALLALGFGFWPRPKATAPEHEQLLRDTAIELKRSREELSRLSQVVSATGSTPGAPSFDTVQSGLGATQVSTTGPRYEVIDLLGEGGMARVYVAVARGAEGFKRTFVLKRLRTEQVGNPEAVNQFIDEARLGASMVHSNIIPVFDFGRDSEGYFLAQEYIIGRNIEAMVQASLTKYGRPLELSVVLFLAQEALKALSYAHTKTDEAGAPLKLVHRDVSPNNLMVSARGELKLLDFGIVKSEQRLTHTQTGMVKGNLFYMSPEQARGQAVDARSDLFALGLVLFYAATGETFFSGTTSYELLTRTAAGPSADDVARIKALPEPLAKLLSRVLVLETTGRFSSADEFAHAVSLAAPAATAGVVRDLMSSLFHDDFAAEQARFFSRAEGKTV